MYEDKVLDRLAGEVRKTPGAALLRQPWIEFTDDHGLRWCQPDAVVLPAAGGQYGFVLEAKYRHCADAWFQLWRLYIPVLEVLYPRIKWAAIEVVKWFDPATSFPEPYDLTPSFLEVKNASRTSIHIFNPSRG